MLQVEMSASVRNATGKGAMRRLRQDGLTPAVVYGAGAAALPLQMETKKLMSQLLQIIRRNAVVTLKVDDGSEKHVMVGEVQTDPVQDTLIHADFCEIDINVPRRFNVPLVYEGVAKGVDMGGELAVYAKDVVLEGKPLDIPDECKLNIKPLKIGDELTYSAIDLPETVTMISQADGPCVGVIKKS